MFINVVLKYYNKIKKLSLIKKEAPFKKASLNENMKNKIDIKSLFNKKFEENIDIFTNSLKTNPNVDLTLFFENLKTLIIEEKNNFNKFIFIKTSTTGHYYGYENKITLLKEDIFYSIYHELLHCASRKYREKQLNCGFYKFIYDDKKKKTIFKLGKGLTEGYTALLEERYFNYINKNKSSSYVVEKFIAEFIERIVEKEKMEKLYFNADLDGLIKELKVFSNEEDIYSFLNYLDTILKGNKKDTTPKKLNEIYEFIARFLLKSYVCKLIALLNNKTISRSTFCNLFDDFVEELSTNVVHNKKNTYYFLTEERTNRLLGEINEALDKKEKIK